MLPVMETQYKDFSTQEFTFDVCGAPTLIIEAPLTPIAWEKGHYEVRSRRQL